MSHDIIILLGSNTNQEQNLTEAQKRLSQILSDIRLSRQMWSEPYHEPGGNLYLNQLVYGSTTMGVDTLQRRLKQIEKNMGRTNEDKHLGIVRIDIDLLSYDGQRYHLKDWERDYVKNLL